MKKLIGILVFLFVFAIVPSISLAADNLDEKVKNAALNYVEIIEKNNSIWTNAKTDYEFPLYDFDGNITSYLFSVKVDGKDSGYLIVSGKGDPVILESTREGNHPYKGKKNENQKAIYVGPTMYYTEGNTLNVFNDLRGDTKIFRSELNSKGPLSSAVLPKFPTEEQPIDVSTIVSYTSKILNVADMAWYIGCSPTAFGNIVRYWDGNGKPNLVQSTTTDRTLIDTLANDMKTNRDTESTDWNNRVTGMVKYWKDRSYSVNVSRVSPSYNTHVSEINNNRPNIINTIGDPTYKNHDMTGVGYEQYQDTNQNLKWTKYVIVHDTWPSTSKHIYLYLDTFSSWNEIVKVVPK